MRVIVGVMVDRHSPTPNEAAEKFVFIIKIFGQGSVWVGAVTRCSLICDQQDETKCIDESIISPRRLQ